jgi:hypothetical protein
VSDENSAFVRELAGGRDYSQDERVSLHVQTLLRTFRRREELLGDALAAPQVAQLLQTSQPSPNAQFASGTLLAAFDRGALRFPAWQFDPNGPNGVVAGLPGVIRALNLSPLARINWFVSPNPYLEGRRPVDALKDGDLDRVLDAARGTGPR